MILKEIEKPLKNKKIVGGVSYGEKNIMCANDISSCHRSVF